ncbi:MAG: DUF1610 domain-containing protein [Calditrichaeota bacterium]|nr:DUF1610 domain-containing protein [Calditrichota bacterium]
MTSGGHGFKFYCPNCGNTWFIKKYCKATNC